MWDNDLAARAALAKMLFAGYISGFSTSHFFHQADARGALAAQAVFGIS